MTITKYQEAANIISSLHSFDIDEEHRLTTEIILLDEFDWYDTNNPNLNTYIRQEVLSQGVNTKYLLLLGNEIDIPPLYIMAADGSTQPSDDFYSSIEEVTTYIELENFVPQISTGRMPVNNSNQAVIVAEKLYKYMIEPTFGPWRSKIGLIADDENKDGYSRNELNHTINSNNIYENLSNTLDISQFYGINYESIENSTYITKPQMTSDIIDYINQGVSLINYIGHGSETTLGGEKIIDMERDFNHICDVGTSCNEENKPAIWVVGTCSFGKYDEADEIMSEKLLFNEAGAISLITTSRGIGAYANNIYLTNLFDTIKQFVLNNNNYRIGDIVRESKRLGKNTEYLFHLLGDPALMMPFPKLSSNLIEEDLLIGSGFQIMADITNDLYESELKGEIYGDINIALLSEEIEFEDSYPDTTIEYTLTGNQIYNGIVSENSCIKIPLDIENCTNCSKVDLTLFSNTFLNEQLYNGYIQIIKDIPVYLNNNFENDYTGPSISINQQGTRIDNGSIVNSNLPVTITIEDEQGINLMEELQHNVRYWFNNDNYIYNLNSTLFDYDNDICGKAYANFLLPHNLNSGNNSINIEAWDNGNNRTLSKYNFILENNEKDHVNHLYNFPNPFKDHTFFTFYLTKYPANIEINIYTVNGKKIKTLKAHCNSYYNTLKWNGRTDAGGKISNGPYFYSFQSNAIINGINYDYQKINKIAKLK